MITAMTTILNLTVFLALLAILVIAVERNHSRNGRPRVAGFTGRIGALPTGRDRPGSDRSR